MSGEDSAGYSDAHSTSSTGGNVIVSDNNSDDASEPRSKKATSSDYWRSESLYLALLFALVALLLPTFFSFASPSSPSPEVTEGRESPLIALLPYVPTLTTIFRLSYSILQIILWPFLRILSVVLALLAPIFLVVNILYKTFVLLPVRIVAGLARFVYPIYLFCGVACIFGAGIGIGGRLLIEGSKMVLTGTTAVGKSRKLA